MTRLPILIAIALLGLAGPILAQSENPLATNATRIVMENERIRIIEINLQPRTKANVETQATRERVLYMLSDGALVLAPSGKTPYEFALRAGEAVLFPPVSPTIENDTDGAVRALLVELKEPAPGALLASKGRTKRKLTARLKSKGKKITATRANPKAKASKPAKPKGKPEA